MPETPGSAWRMHAWRTWRFSGRPLKSPLALSFRGVEARSFSGRPLCKRSSTRIFGFEILTAPYVVAHLQIGLFLSQIGAPLIDSEEERAGVYLTNALTGWNPKEASGEKPTFSEFKAERLAAEHVKQEEPILVILGNPPYSGYAGIAVGEERELSDAYRETEEAPAPQGHGLNDLYVRFYRMAERQIVEHNGRGVISYISNYSWLDGLSHTGMRERYLDVFDQIWIDNMNGDKYRTGKRTPEGNPDPSVFSTDYSRIGIQVGTAVSVLCRHADHEGAEEVHYREFWGTEKRSELLETADLSDAEGYEEVDPPLKLGLPFMPRTTGTNYLDWPTLPEMFPHYFPGVQTKRDDFVIDIDKKRLIERIENYFNPNVSDKEMREICPRAMKETSGFDAKETRDYLKQRGFKPEYIVRHVYRPMDIRWLYWEPETNLLERKSPDYFPHVFNGNVAFTSSQRSRKEYSPPCVGESLMSLHMIEYSASCFPMYLNPKAGENDLFHQSRPDGSDGTQPIPNLSDAAAGYLNETGGDVEALFYHTVALLHAPTYRQENEGALRQDWPRVPLPKDGDLLQRSADLGRQVAALLDVEHAVKGVTAGTPRPELRPLGAPTPTGDREQLSREDFAVTAGWGYTAHHGATMPGGGKYEERSLTPEEETALPDGAGERWGTTTLDVYLNDRAYWKHIPDRVWSYTLGGYPVIKKWLSYRERDVLGRRLKLDEIQHVTEMTRRIAALLLLEPRLDSNYDAVKTEARGRM